jgi:hypothetical protein
MAAERESAAVGVGNSRVVSGSEGPPVCVLYVQFFASEAVGVGSNRNCSSNDRPPCFLSAPTPLDEPSYAIGVGNTFTSPTVSGQSSPREQEHSLPTMSGPDVGRANATPERVIPRFGQVAEYTVESSAFPAKRGDVLHDEQRGS